MTPVPKRWLQRELRWRLMLPVLGIVVLSAALSAYGAKFLVDRVFDRWLLDAARSLAGQVRFSDGRAEVELSPQADALLTYDIVDRSYYEVRQQGRHLIGQRGLPAAGANEQDYSAGARVFDGRIAGQPVRVAWVPAAGADGAQAQVIVAETRIKRRHAQRDLLLILAPIGLLVLAAALFIDVALRRTLQPLERIAMRWSERSHVSLQPIPTDDVPRELVPFALALNELHARVRSVLERERQFAATAAHQLRTPLTGLQLGLARAVEAPDLAGTRAVLGELGAATQRTARLVQQLLAFSRLDPEMRAGMTLVEVDLLALARDVGEAYLDAAQRKQIELALDCDGPRVLVHGQPELLSEALGNLIDNAIRYTPAGGRVTITVQGGPAAIAVADSGPGIADDETARVFERFVRGRSAQGEGSGLGLAIVKEIATLHDAQVSLGRGPLGGLCITLRFAGDGGRPG